MTQHYQFAELKKLLKAPYNAYTGKLLDECAVICIEENDLSGLKNLFYGKYKPDFTTLVDDPLKTACQKGYLDIAKELCESPMLAYARDNAPQFQKSYLDILESSCQSGNVELLKYMINKSSAADIYFFHCRDKYTLAVKSGNNAMLQYVCTLPQNENFSKSDAVYYIAAAGSIEMLDTVMVKMVFTEENMSKAIQVGAYHQKIEFLEYIFTDHRDIKQYEKTVLSHGVQNISGTIIKHYVPQLGCSEELFYEIIRHCPDVLDFIILDIKFDKPVNFYEKKQSMFFQEKSFNYAETLFALRSAQELSEVLPIPEKINSKRNKI